MSDQSENKRRKLTERVYDSNSNTKITALRTKANAKKQVTNCQYLAGETVLKAISMDDLNSSKVSYDMGIGVAGDFQIIAPANDPEILRKIPYENNMLYQCIEAFVQNIAGTGYSLEFLGEDGEQDDKEPQTEKSIIKQLLDVPNEEYSLGEFLKRLSKDKENIGYAFFEVIRDDVGAIISVYHVPAHTIRLTSCEKEPQIIDVKLMRDGREVSIKRQKFFRRYVQIIPNATGTAKKVFFKEFGDKRVINRDTGKAEEVDTMTQATELVMISDYKSGYLYGMPRWINQLPSIFGAREAEVVNLKFFQDNAIPAMAILVSGGALSQDTVDKIADMFSPGKGKDRMNEVMVIEALGDESSGSPEGQIPVPKLEMKPLAGERQSDALFLEYDKRCQDNIRGAFRMPPLLLGQSQDYSHATADSSMAVCEAQVFQPEREIYNEIVNKFILGDGYNGPKYWKFKLNPTKMVDKNAIAQNINALTLAGALTPNAALNLVNELFGLKMDAIPQDWGDYPFEITKTLVKGGQVVAGLEHLLSGSGQNLLGDAQAANNTDTDNKDNKNTKDKPKK